MKPVPLMPFQKRNMSILSFGFLLMFLTLQPVLATFHFVDGNDGMFQDQVCVPF